MRARDRYGWNAPCTSRRSEGLTAEIREDAAHRRVANGMDAKEKGWMDAPPPCGEQGIMPGIV